MYDFKYTSIDLFSGPGGLCTGLKETGIKPLIAVEFSECTVATYSQTHGADVLVLSDYLANPNLAEHRELFKPSDNTLMIHGDVTKVSNDLIDKILRERFGVTNVDVVTGGAPCESFSMAGQRRDEDERNNLFLNLERIAKHVDAKILLFENVKGLLSKPLNGEKGGMYNLVCDELERANENGTAFKLVSRDPKEVMLKCSDYGVPQHRERIFLVGINSKYDAEYIYPEKTHGPNRANPYVSVGEALFDLPHRDMREGEEEMDYTLDEILSGDLAPHHREFLEFMNGSGFTKPAHLNDKVSSHIAPGHRPRMVERFENILPGEGTRKAGERLIAEGKQEIRDELFPRVLYNSAHNRLEHDKPCNTITGHVLDSMLHPTLNRGLTPREAARLQSFPDWYKFQGPYVNFHSNPLQNRYEQIGDAIPPIMGYHLGRELRKTLDMITETNEVLSK